MDFEALLPQQKSSLPVFVCADLMPVAYHEQVKAALNNR